MHSNPHYTCFLVFTAWNKCPRIFFTFRLVEKAESKICVCESEYECVIVCLYVYVFECECVRLFCCIAGSSRKGLLQRREEEMIYVWKKIWDFYQRKNTTHIISVFQPQSKSISNQGSIMSVCVRSFFFLIEE